nr:hydroxyacid dehydrogenase [Micromonospora sp. DSM 115978]
MSQRPLALLAMQPWALADLLPPDLLSRLRVLVRLGSERPATSFRTAAVAAALPGAELLLTGWGCPRVNGAVLDAAPRLKTIVHAAGSVKGHVDPAVFARGVTVSSAARTNAVPVAEYTVAVLVLAAKRALTRANWFARDRAAGDWRSGAGTGLYGRTIGVVGASWTGRLVLERLRAFDVRLLLADPYATPAQADTLGAELVDLDQLCRRSDLVTLHAPALPQTYHLIDARRLDLLKDGAALINTGRGSLVDTAALTTHCVKGRIDAVLDVTDPEPLPADHPLLHLHNVLVTPHLAGSQGGEMRRLGEFAIAEVERLIRGQPLLGAIRGEDLHRMA